MGGRVIQPQRQKDFHNLVKKGKQEERRQGKQFEDEML